MPLDEDAQSTLDELIGQTDKAQNELTHEVLVLHAANFEAVTTDAGPNPEAYHQTLSNSECILLDVDFLHTSLDYVEGDDGEPTPKFLDAIDRVTMLHAREYHDQFESLAEFLDWLSFCNFLTVHTSEDGIFHVVSPIGSVKWFMPQFIAFSTKQSPLDIEVEEDVSKVFLTEIR